MWSFWPPRYRVSRTMVLARLENVDEFLPTSRDFQTRLLTLALEAYRR